jgi:hypothetical protein
MRNAAASVVPDAIRIEDEVWQDAFARRERPTRRPAEERAGVAPVRSADVAASSAALPAPRASAQSPAVMRPGEPVAGRRTVTIRGRGAEGHLPWPGEGRAQRSRRAHERHGFRPDRFAMWAVLLGLLLIAVAVASPHS